MPPPPPVPKQTTARSQAPLPPAVAPSGPPGAFLVELLIYSGAPFKDHWSYWVRSHQDPDLGVLMHAAGDVRKGFQFEIKRGHDFRATGNLPTKRIPLQCVGKEFFIEKAMFNSGQYKVDQTPVCYFEVSAHKVKVPEKTLRAVGDKEAFFDMLRPMLSFRPENRPTTKQILESEWMVKWALPEYGKIQHNA